MKYKVNIEGGFTGLPREYAGEISLGANGKNALLEAMGSKLAQSNQNLRDGLFYRIRLEDGDKIYQADFSGPDLPNPIRNFINEIKG